MTTVVSQLGPNDCTTASVDGRDVLIVAEGQTEVNVGDGAYINQRSEGKSVGLYEVDGSGGGYNTVADVQGDDGEWFAGFEIDWQSGETSQGSFSDDKLVVNAASTSYPAPVFPSSDAYTILEGDTSEMDKVVDSSILVGLEDTYCRGDEYSVTVIVQNKSICKAIDVEVQVTNELTGASNTYNITNDFTETNDLRRLNSVRQDISDTIPDDAPIGQQDILTVDVVSSEAVNDPSSYTLSTFIGTRPENLSLQPVEDIEDVCPGDDVSPSFTAVNSGLCEQELGIEITNDFNDTVTEIDATNVPVGQSTDGTHTYSFANVPVPENSPSDITYTASLVRPDGS